MARAAPVRLAALAGLLHAAWAMYPERWDLVPSPFSSNYGAMPEWEKEVRACASDDGSNTGWCCSSADQLSQCTNSCGCRGSPGGTSWCCGGDGVCMNNQCVPTESLKGMSCLAITKVSGEFKKPEGYGDSHCGRDGGSPPVTVTTTTTAPPVTTPPPSNDDLEYVSCPGQARFNVIVCKSHMCNECVLQYCTEQCQAWQLEFPGCRCEHWPKARKSYSGGEFEGKGAYGDVGDYGN